MYMQNHGVPFSYTDKQTYKQIEDLLQLCKEVDEEMEKLREQ